MSKDRGGAGGSAAPTRPESGGSLEEYRRKRSPDRTPEPFGEGGQTFLAGAGRFTIQKHAARRIHYDLRLEMDGVLVSWAVPKGVSTDPAEKRLAVHVEDHPLDYADFEGVIPEGEYGAGAVIVWDQGRWIPLEDPERGLESGKLLFELRGHKLRGVWTLVKLRKSESGRDWLLIRERRGGGTLERDDRLSDASVFSGLTLEEFAAWKQGELDPGEPLRRELEGLLEEGAGLRRRRLEPGSLKLMLAGTRERPFSRTGWLFEAKLDGYRILARGGGSGPLLLTRNGKDATGLFPELALALGRLPFDHVVLDGEAVVHDARGLPSFQRLQGRGRLRRPIEVRRAALERPATLYAFDLLGFDDFDLRGLPLRTRKRLLRRVLPPAGSLRYCEHVEEHGEELFEQAVRMGLEGIVAKDAESPYRGGRSRRWWKIRADRTGDFVVVGYTKPARSRVGFGALHLALWDPAAGEAPEGGPSGAGGGFVYVGRVGSGFRADQLRAIREALDAIRRPEPPCRGPVPEGPGHVWTEPRLVVEVRYRERTADGLLRQPVFLRLRDDKLPEECGIGSVPRSSERGELDLEADPAPGGPGAHRGGRPEPRADPPAASRAGGTSARPGSPIRPRPGEVSLSHLDKPFWPEDGYTKGDLIRYYRKVAPWLLPYLADRPLVLTRYPDGIHGKHFFQKDAPDFVPDWIRTERIWSEGAEREIAYFVVEDEASLLYLANLGTIPFHLWASRTGSVDRPDWCVLDLDPKDAPFSDVIRIARSLHGLCEEIGLPTYVKTTGSTGLHVLIPLGAQVGYEESRALGELLARMIERELPEIATTVRNPARRGGKVYLDYLQNRRGQTIVAPYSVRPLPGAPVSAPLRWREVRPGLTIARFTIRSLPRRLGAMKDDPVRPVLSERPDLFAALERLQARMEG